MNETNAVAVSYDQLSAVRKHDGLRLVAAPSPIDPEKCTGRGRCAGCAAAGNAARSQSCFVTEWPGPGLAVVAGRSCMSPDRKDGRNIIWKPVKE